MAYFGLPGVFHKGPLTLLEVPQTHVITIIFFLIKEFLYKKKRNGYSSSGRETNNFDCGWKESFQDEISRPWQIRDSIDISDMFLSNQANVRSWRKWRIHKKTRLQFWKRGLMTSPSKTRLHKPHSSLLTCKFVLLMKKFLFSFCFVLILVPLKPENPVTCYLKVGVK